MNQPILSILIASIPSRLGNAMSMFGELNRQCGMSSAGEVEILMLTDNKTRSVGMKRQSLLDLAKGEYVAWVDDDDEVSEDYVSSILKAILVEHVAHGHPKPDLVVWPILVTINGGQEGFVMPSIQNAADPIPEYAPPMTKRPPHHLCCWKAELARKGKFPDIQHGEDFQWARQVWPHIKSEALIPNALYHYKWDKNVTEAEPV